MPKRTLRKQMLAQRRALSRDIWLSASDQAQRLLMLLPEYLQASCIAVYAPFQSETDTSAIVEHAFSRGITVLYPAVCGSEMVMRQVTALEHLLTGTFGILEPCDSGDGHQADEADLILIPGVAFDLRGHRIGYGKGYYDRFLSRSNYKAHRIGFCHDFQIIEGDLPSEKHDICMHTIVTERRVIRCGSNRCHSGGAD